MTSPDGTTTQHPPGRMRLATSPSHQLDVFTSVSSSPRATAGISSHAVVQAVRALGPARRRAGRRGAPRQLCWSQEARLALRPEGRDVRVLQEAWRK